MKKLLFAAIPLLFVATIHNAAACDYSALEARISQQIEQAKINNSDNQAQGYQQALDALKTCHDISILVQQSQTKIDQMLQQLTKLQREVSQAEINLNNALNQNNQAKIAEFEKIVGEKEEDLMELQDNLEIAQAEVQALTSQ